MQFSITNSLIYPRSSSSSSSSSSFSSSSSSSQLYGFGFNEAVSDNPMQTDSYLNENERSFYMDMTVPHIQSSFIGGVYSQFPFANYQSGTLSAMTIQSLDLPSYGSNNLDNQKQKQKQSQAQVERLHAQPSHELGSIVHGVTRKRTIEKVGEMATQGRPQLLGGSGPSKSHEWTAPKKMPTPVQKKMQRLNHHAQKDTVVPPRKSQKLAEKITALQKLVSPYGKTDTASVLHEASIFINVLLDQIESSVHPVEDEHDLHQSNLNPKVMADKEYNLKGKGFCLVPVSLTKNLIRYDPFTNFSTIDDMLPQNRWTTHCELPK